MATTPSHPTPSVNTPYDITVLLNWLILILVVAGFVYCGYAGWKAMQVNTKATLPVTSSTAPASSTEEAQLPTLQLNSPAYQRQGAGTVSNPQSLGKENPFSHSY